MSCKNILYKWAKFLNYKEFEKLKNLYHPKSVLIPTFNTNFLCSENTKYHYFKNLDPKTHVRFKDINEVIIENNTILFGNYTFSLSESIMYAQFNFIFNKNLIISHTSKKISTKLYKDELNEYNLYNKSRPSLDILGNH